ncbi:MAG: hypothetical protein ACREI7_14345 [Myxococcota bacterium]
MACDRPFPDGAMIVSAVYADGEGFLRRDLCEPCFPGREGAFSAWKTRQPRTEEERVKLDLDLARDFLRRLVREGDPARAGLSYLLALLLARKRRVRILETVRGAGAETLRVQMPGDEGDEVVELRVPALDDAETARLQAELSGLFGP